MKKINRRGFTLIELLASMVILGMIMAIAIPNVMGILNNSRNKTYVQDAKKLLSLAEYKFRSSQNIYKPKNGEMVIMRLDYLDNSEFEDAPNGKPYDKEKSYVVIFNVSESVGMKYYAVLLDSDGKGVAGYQESFASSKPSTLVKNSIDVQAPYYNGYYWLFNVSIEGTVSQFHGQKYYNKNGEVNH